MAAVEAATASHATPPPTGTLPPEANTFGFNAPVAPGAPTAPAGPSPPLEETVDIMRKLAAQGVTAARVNPRSWMSLTDSELAQLNAAKKELDFEFVEVPTFLNPMHPDATIRAGYIKQCIANMEACERVGCRCIGVTAGSRHMSTMASPNNYSADPDNWTLASWKMCLDYFKQVLNATRGMKTRLGTEANLTSILNTPLAHKNFIEDLADERVSVVFDPSNLIHLFNYYRTTEMLTECFAMWGELINNAHGKSCYIEPRTQLAYCRQVTPGLGTMDYETLLTRLSRLKWARSITPEITMSEWPAAYAYIRQVAARVDVKIHGVQGSSG